MEVTLLGTGDATGVPVPLCECPYCIESDRRRTPGLAVNAGKTTLLFDVGPDISEKLATTDIQSIDAGFLTHAHGDHSGGLPRLYQAAKWDREHLDSNDEFEPTPAGFDPGYSIYLTETARSHLREEYGFLDERLDLRLQTCGEQISFESVTVKAFPVEHHRPTFETLGFVVVGESATVAYAPDMRTLVGAPPSVDVDLLVCEGAALLGQPVHGPKDALEAAIESIGTNRTILVNVNEHIQRAHTDELRERACDQGYELVTDFTTISFGEP